MLLAGYLKDQFGEGAGESWAPRAPLKFEIFFATSRHEGQLAALPVDKPAPPEVRPTCFAA